MVSLLCYYDTVPSSLLVCRSSLATFCAVSVCIAIKWQSLTVDKRVFRAFSLTLKRGLLLSGGSLVWGGGNRYRLGFPLATSKNWRYFRGGGVVTIGGSFLLEFYDIFMYRL